MSTNHAKALLEIDQLSIQFGEKTAVDALSLSLQAGERLALVGESGSGKSVTALAILRLLNAARVQGQIRFAGDNLNAKSERQMQAIRGADISMVFQEPMTALNPVYTIGRQIAESISLHQGVHPRAARPRVIELLEQVGIDDAARRSYAYPHQLSGGQRQRAVIAMALACRPRLLLADEPTTALDVTLRRQIIDLLLDVQKQQANGQNMAILLITHDLGLVRHFAQRVAVMEHGRLVEVAPVEALFTAPQHPYTRKLLASTPRREVRPVAADAPVLLQARGVAVDYPVPGKGLAALVRPATRLRALDGIDLDLRAGETLGIVGESGSGKSTLAAALLGLQRTSAGEIRVFGRPRSDYARRERRALSARIQAVFQDPFSSLSPRQTVEQIVGEGVALHQRHFDADARCQLVLQALAEVGLPADAAGRFPHEFSGGQRQRIAIARALILQPAIVILDEPTSALDVSIQQQILQLLTDLQQRHGFAYVLISHDIAVVRALAHRVLVTCHGRIVEHGEVSAILTAPSHGYTKKLIESV
ncbi:ABC transporter ATP-binding protein [Corticibacter populi]|uniref:ABC transporter ATP-binding protein n=1 Tax=Corticibacter populi TaxID=1550736 RepID=A0A3M6QS33_9BURK|nr:dipeptide ABC transporter ATP-binding protein [Corticibacter populi]RMX05848.1 ABC transporter ATP-binding protein [Corticibacter populi]RZS30835.1 microcin C transport system ATP-binding protein [Corticibacter populi]